jgi:phosphoglycerol transferase MdoB-like AlkP superfamily enzyme
MENQASTKSFIINNGVILGVLGVLISVINYAFGTHLDPHWSTSLASGIFFIGLIILGISQFKKANNGQGVKIGVGIAILAALISVIYNYIFVTFVEPDFMAQIMELQNQKFLEQGMSQEQIEAANAMTEKFKSPLITSAFGIIASAIGGFIVSAIAAAIMKKSEEETF